MADDLHRMYRRTACTGVAVVVAACALLVTVVPMHVALRIIFATSVLLGVALIAQGAAGMERERLYRLGFGSTRYSAKRR